ncbi:MAG: hypothetical protein R3C14_52090 [Caldilineaceae bacterium]
MPTKLLILRFLLVIVLLLITAPTALASPNLQQGNGHGNGSQPTGERQKKNKHEHGREDKRAPVERKGQYPQPQQAVSAPKTKKQKKDLATESGADSANQAELDFHLYLPYATQDGSTAATESAAVDEAAAARAVLARAATATQTIDLKVLVISADGNETDFPAITAFLSQIGIPYDVLIGTQTQLTWDMLSNAVDHGYYQGIILATGNLGYLNPATNQWESAFDGNEWFALWAYESMFGVRQVTSYTYPGGWPDTYGLNYVNVTTAPVNATLTTAGRQIYPYLKPTLTIPIKNSWTYLATVANPAVTTALVTSGNYAIASITSYTDGRQNLAITTGNNPYLIHSLLLSYGTINWVTKGLFLGERHVYMSPQVDDLLIDSDMWDTRALTDTTGLLYRMSGTDFSNVIAWQNSARTTYPVAVGLTLELAFNGTGTVDYSPDTLLPVVIQNQSKFNWVSHTYTHPSLDPISYAEAITELTQNDATALSPLALTHYFKDSLVQPDISGLYNSAFHAAAKDFGLKYLISDTSQPNWNNPSPNAGFYSTFQPSILIIPRRPTNLFYNLRTQAEWVSEYNCYYGPTGTCAGGRFRYWPQNLTYNQILDKESDMWLQYLLKWDIDPLMFHQANLGTYGSRKSLLGDLINATLAKYNALYTLPIQSLPQHTIGEKMAQRMAYNASGVQASMIPCQSITLTANQPAVIPMTGLTSGANTEVYGGQTISYIQLNAGQSLTIPAPACP